MIISAYDFCNLLSLNLGHHYRGVTFRPDMQKIGSNKGYRVIAVGSNGASFNNISLLVENNVVTIYGNGETIQVGNDFEVVKQVLGLYVLAKASIGIRFNNLKCVGHGLIGGERGFAVKTENRFTAVVYSSTAITLLRAGCKIDGLALRGKGLQVKKDIPLAGKMTAMYAWLINS